MAVSLWLQFEPVAVDVNLVTHDYEGPYPCQRFKNIEGVEWDPESLVVEICSFTFLSEVLIIILSNKVDNWASQVHQPYRQKQVTSVDIDDMSEHYDERWSEIRRDVSHELGSFLNDDYFTTVLSSFY